MTDRSPDLGPLSPPFRALLATARDLVDAHLDAHSGYVAWSGGPNSTAVMLIARQMAPHVPVVWFAGDPHPAGTRERLTALAEELNVNFHPIDAPATAEADHTARLQFGYGLLTGERLDASATNPLSGAVCAPLTGWADDDVQAVLTAASIRPEAV